MHTRRSNTTPQRRTWPALEAACVLAGVVLVFCLPFATQFTSHSPTNVGWDLCAVVAVALLLVSGWRLAERWREGSVVSRLLLYVALGVAVGSACFLADLAYRERQIRYWSHRGIHFR